MKNKKSLQTNWYVITGGPSSGKTTIIDMLAKKGFKTTIEHARHYIDTMRVDGQTVEEIRSNKKEFQLGVLKMQIEQEASLNPDDIVFLDRAIPDALAYYRFLGLEVDEILKEAMQKVNYKKIFILDKLPLINDYARLESKVDQEQIQNHITEVYESLSFPVIHVPVLPPLERLEFILNSINNN
jgi:predicted ATPase